MPALDSYSSLESLLLFQSLAAHGTRPESFDKVSLSLRNSNFLPKESRSDEEYLSAASLQNLYLALLKEEAKLELLPLSNDEHGKRSPKKRKAPSPQLPTIEDAAKYTSLVPRVINRLYARYRDQTTKDIEDQERTYHTLADQLHSLQSNHEKDGNAALDVILNKSESRPPTREGFPNIIHDSDSSPPAPEDEATARAKRTHSRKHNASIDSIINHDEPNDRPNNSNSTSANDNHQTTQVNQIPYQSPPFGHHSLPIPAQLPHSSVQPLASTLVLPRPTSMPQSSFPPNPPWAPTHDLTNTQTSPPFGNQSDARRMSFDPHSAWRQPSSGQSRHSIHSTIDHRQQPHSNHTPRGGIQLPPFQVSSQIPTVNQQETSNRASFQKPQRSAPENSQLRKSVGSIDNYAYRTADPNFQLTPINGRTLDHVRNAGISVSPGSVTRWRLPLGTTLSGEADQPRDISPIADDISSSKQQTSSRKLQNTKSMHNKSTKSSSPRQNILRGNSIASLPESGLKHEPSTPAHLTDDTDGDNTIKTRKPKRNPNKQPVNNLLENAVSARDQASHDVVASRNFGKSSKGILDVIQSHKHASVFSHPIRERDAEGYYEIIHQPQDLKSIKNAIAAGTRAVAAALEGQASPGKGTTASGGTITLPYNEALVPPKGIVNAAQLEQEVYRMLANAVMFNPGKDEIVMMAREMFKDVEGSLNAWREVDRNAMDNDVDEVSVVDDVQSSNKRRKV